MTTRRYRVHGEIPDDFREVYQDGLEQNAFHEPTSSVYEGESIGWTHQQNLLNTDFSDLNCWLYNHYLVAAMRVDKKVLPGKLFSAHLNKRVHDWCRTQGQDRAPSRVVSDIKEALKQEMLMQTLPRVQLYEFCWHIVDGWVIFLNTSSGANDRFRTLFRKTFGCVLMPFSPLEFLSDQPDTQSLLATQGNSDYRPQSRDSKEAL